MLIDSDQVPENLYKYRSLNGHNWEFVQRTIENYELYFSPSNEFNDPFDCRWRDEFSGSDEQILKYCEHLVSAHEPNLSSYRKRHEIRRCSKKIKQHNRGVFRLDDTLLTHHQDLLSNVGIFCTSEVPDDILMWSHYADGHRGVCLKFTSKNSEFFARALPVTYSDDIPILNPIIDDSKALADKALLVKSPHWLYEKEWRIIDMERGPGVQVFPPRTLVGIILGCKIGDDLTNRIIDLCQKRTCFIQVFKAIPSETHFRLQIEKIEN